MKLLTLWLSLLLATSAYAQGRSDEVPGRMLHGKAAHDFVAKLKATDPEYRAAMIKADADLTSRGLSRAPDADIAVVFEPDAMAETAPSLWDAMFPTLHASTYVTNGYATFTAYTDGDNRTWEGNMYARNSTFQASLSLNGQWSDKGEWIAYQYWNTQQRSSATSATPWSPPGWHGGRCDGTNISQHVVQHSMQNAAAYCVMSASVCALTAPAWFMCFSAGCIGSFAKALVDEEMLWVSECNKSCMTGMVGCYSGHY